jgi:hypothetical protein
LPNRQIKSKFTTESVFRAVSSGPARPPTESRPAGSNRGGCGLRKKNRIESTSGRPSLVGGLATSVLDGSLSLARTAASDDDGLESPSPIAARPCSPRSRTRGAGTRSRTHDVDDTGTRATSYKTRRRLAVDRSDSAAAGKRAPPPPRGLSAAVRPFRGRTP